ncbi:hypothetical protein GZ77_12375 [Endozoicomonas montiporae]|uniref:Uncharacterized protein n=2 Tax=Endozoicomonas montiporae TaxID=1027273 RepID=A0A081N462_9GAMM|nr:hypothetical protein EZMO1_3994 [Endozoicomonas montiporae CL-33]KEQ13235.1 hypothetical protein GZ77_12375 [Endozoicomonas montiporae]
MRKESQKAFRELGLKPGCTRNCDGRESAIKPLNSHKAFVVYDDLGRFADFTTPEPGYLPLQNNQ